MNLKMLTDEIRLNIILPSNFCIFLIINWIISRYCQANIFNPYDVFYKEHANCHAKATIFIIVGSYISITMLGLIFEFVGVHSL